MDVVFFKKVKMSRSGSTLASGSNKNVTNKMTRDEGPSQSVYIYGCI
jgi:hypothetical protein